MDLKYVLALTKAGGPGHRLTLGYLKLVEAVTSYNGLRHKLGEQAIENAGIACVSQLAQTYTIMAVSHSLVRNLKQGQGNRGDTLKVVAKNMFL
jgi:hypothetical protein